MRGIIFDKDLNSGQLWYVSKDHEQLYKNLLGDPIPLLVHNDDEDEEGWNINCFFPGAKSITSIVISENWQIPGYTLGQLVRHEVIYETEMFGRKFDLLFIAYSEQSASPLSVFVSLSNIMNLKEIGLKVDEPDWCV
jgi:hypothetical protein